LSANAADFPAVATAPGFTYRYNPKLELFEPSTANLGPVFVERPQTLGKGKMDFGFSYLYVDFDQLEGEDLEGLEFRGLSHNDCCRAGNPPPSPGDPSFEIDTADFRYEEFDLTSHVFNFSGTYGVTDAWDVNLLVPVVYTSVDVRGRATLNNESGSDTHFFETESGTTVEERSFDDEAFGVGDLQLRSKFRFYDADALGMATGLALRVPTGDEDDFQGLGDTTLTPYLSAAHGRERLEIHASTGVQINFEDADRSRLRYAGGVTFQLVDRLALLVDVVGNSNLVVDRIGVTVPQFVNAPGTSEAPPTTIPAEVRFTDNVFTNIIDIAPGLKGSLSESVVGWVTVFVPLNDDGLRADFIPAGGVQATF
ncbi:MAG: transporter, partial [Candidatus Binatia bacterium]